MYLGDLDERMDYLSLILASHKNANANANAIAIHGTAPTQEHSSDHEWNGKPKRMKMEQQPGEF